MITQDLHEKRCRERMELMSVAEKDEQIADPVELGAAEDKKRSFVEHLRPHKRIWNFI